jgi:hypothetical protein
MPKPKQRLVYTVTLYVETNDEAQDKENVGFELEAQLDEFTFEVGGSKYSCFTLAGVGSTA